MVKIFIIDSTIYRQGLESILQGYPEFQVVGGASKPAEATSKIEETKPDIIVIDAFQNNGESVKSINLVKEKFPGTKIIALTQSQRDEDCLIAIHAGARAYLMKNLEPTVLADSIRLVAGGNAIVYTGQAIKLVEGLSSTSKDEARSGNNCLSPREREILHLVAQGINTREIATNCFVSQTTVKAHLRRILDKLEAKNRAQAIARAIEKGILRET